MTNTFFRYFYSGGLYGKELGSLVTPKYTPEASIPYKKQEWLKCWGVSDLTPLFYLIYFA